MIALRRVSNLCMAATRATFLGLLLACNGFQDSVAAALEAHGCFETVCRELQEWTRDAADRTCMCCVAAAASRPAPLDPGPRVLPDLAG